VTIIRRTLLKCILGIELIGVLRYIWSGYNTSTLWSVSHCNTKISNKDMISNMDNSNIKDLPCGVVVLKIPWNVVCTIAKSFCKAKWYFF
jgi:hypothetical protein